MLYNMDVALVCDSGSQKAEAKSVLRLSLYSPRPMTSNAMTRNLKQFWKYWYAVCLAAHLVLHKSKRGALLLESTTLALTISLKS